MLNMIHFTEKNIYIFFIQKEALRKNVNSSKKAIALD